MIFSQILKVNKSLDVYFQQAYATNNVRRSSSDRRIWYWRTLDLHKGIKNTEHGKYVFKQRYFIFTFKISLEDNWLKKITMYVRFNDSELKIYDNNVFVWGEKK